MKSFHINSMKYYKLSEQIANNFNETLILPVTGIGRLKEEHLLFSFCGISVCFHDICLFYHKCYKNNSLQMDKIFIAIPLFVYQSAYKTKKFWKSKYFERGIKGYLNNPIHGYLFKHFVHSAYTRSFSYFEYIKQYSI